MRLQTFRRMRQTAFLLICLFFFIPFQTNAQKHAQSGAVDYRVYQRSDDNVATIPLQGACVLDGLGKLRVRLMTDRGVPDGFDWKIVGAYRNRGYNAQLKQVPTGGPYRIDIQFLDKKNVPRVTKSIHHILVGDLWILAGQSNMQGVGDLASAESADMRVNAFGFNETWSIATEPLHLLLDSIDPVHHLGLEGDALESARISARKNAVVGAGCGLPFAKKMVAETGVPIGADSLRARWYLHGTMGSRSPR